MSNKASPSVVMVAKSLPLKLEKLKFSGVAEEVNRKKRRTRK